VVDLDTAVDVAMGVIHPTDRGEGEHQPLRDVPGAESTKSGAVHPGGGFVSR
jgi:hypothetical protein